MRALIQSIGALAALLAFANHGSAQLLERAPSRLEGDGDADSVPNRSDLCPSTPRGLTPLELGCAAVELGSLAELKLVALSDQFEALQTIVATEPELDSLLTRATLARQTIEEATDQLSRGELVLAASAFEQTTKVLDESTRAVAYAQANVRISARDIPDHAHEFHGYELRSALLSRVQLSLGELSDELRRQSRSLRAAASSLTGRLVTRGVVEAVEGRTVRLIGGPTILVPASVRTEPMFAGMEVEIAGSWFGREPQGLATEVFAEGFSWNPELFQINCRELLVEPVQRSVAQQDRIQHTLTGYRHNGVLWLEKGMRLNARDAGGCSYRVLPDGTIEKDSISLTMSFTDTQGQARYHVPVGNWIDLWNPNSIGGALPSSVDPTKPATLRVSTITIVCPPGKNVCNGTTTHVEEHAVRVRDRGSYCVNVQYDEDVFSLEYAASSTFEPTHVTSYLPLFVEGTDKPVKFRAQAYAIANGLSSYPNVQTITDSQPFAIHREDFFHQNHAPQTASQATGVSAPAGLMWPRLEGTRGGRSFRYSCRVPLVVRDRLNICDAGVDSYYRLPYTAYPKPLWSVSQGNFGAFSHEKSHAWDIWSVEPQNTQDATLVSATEDIRAARSGKVVWVEDANTENCFDIADGDKEGAKQAAADGKCNGNGVAIEHEDKSVSFYFHLKANTAVVAVDQLVKRGAVLGKEGNIGYSTGPHLHFEVGTFGAGTMASLFQTQASTCVNPQKNDKPLSNNTPL